MGVIARIHEPRCKICSHPRRVEIDALLEKRSQRIRDPETKKLLYSRDIVIKTLLEWGITNPTPDNVDRHWQKHCEVVSDAEATSLQDALNAASQEMLDIINARDGSVEGDLHAIRAMSMARLRQKALRNEDVGVTVDMGLKATTELTRRASSEAARDLLSTLAGGISKALGGPGRKEIADAEVVLEIEAAEVVEVEEP
jgi:hypothetical protein